MTCSNSLLHFLCDFRFSSTNANTKTLTSSASCHKDGDRSSDRVVQQGVQRSPGSMRQRSTPGGNRKGRGAFGSRRFAHAFPTRKTVANSYLLGIPRYHRIKCYLLIAACVDDFDDATDLLAKSDVLWYMARDLARTQRKPPTSCLVFFVPSLRLLAFSWVQTNKLQQVTKRSMRTPSAHSPSYATKSTR